MADSSTKHSRLASRRILKLPTVKRVIRRRRKGEMKGEKKDETDEEKKELLQNGVDLKQNGKDLFKLEII